MQREIFQLVLQLCMAIFYRSKSKHSMQSHKTVVVIPAFNEEKTVGTVVKELTRHVDAVVVVDDHSSDKTKEVAEMSGATVIRHEENKGYDGSLNDGFKKAHELGADIFISFDADGEHDFRDIPLFTEPITLGDADIVVGNRGKLTHFSEKIYALYTRIAYGVKDPLCGFKAYSREVYESVGYFDSVSSIGTELMIQGAVRGFRIKTVSIRLHVRVNDSSRFYARRFSANVKIFKAMLRVFLTTI